MPRKLPARRAADLHFFELTSNQVHIPYRI